MSQPTLRSPRASMIARVLSGTCRPARWQEWQTSGNVTNSPKLNFSPQDWQRRCMGRFVPVLIQ
jgi:hypothetical protein